MRKILLLLILSFFFAGCSAQPLKEEPLRIGVISSLSGRFAIFGEYNKNGLDMALEEIHASGGILGKDVVLDYQDVQIDAKQSVSAFRKLVDVENAEIVIGGDFSTITAPIIPLANEKEVLLISSNQALNNFTHEDSYYCQMLPRIDEQAEVFAQHVFDHVGSRVSIVYADQQFAIDHKESFSKHFATAGGQIVSEHAFLYTDTDFRSILTQIKQDNVDAIYLPFSGLGHLKKQAIELGIDAVVLGPYSTETPDYLAQAGSAADGVLYPYFYPDTNASERMQQFKQTFLRRHNRQPTVYEAASYDLMYLLKKSIESCEEVSGPCVREKIGETKGYAGASGELTFDAACNLHKDIQIKTVQDGVFVEVN